MEIPINPVRFATEEQFQAAATQWFHNSFFAERGMLHCNMNNSASRNLGAKAKALGVSPGVSDLELILPYGKVVFIELKLPGRPQSPVQVEWEKKCKERHHLYVVIDTLEDFKHFINQCFNAKLPWQ